MTIFADMLLNGSPPVRTLSNICTTFTLPDTTIQGGVVGIDNNNNHYLAGLFSKVDGNNMNCISRWDGSNWNALGAGLDTWGVRGDMDFDSNYLYVTGAFTSAGGVSNTSKIARWDGSNWSAMGTGLNNNGLRLAFDASKSSLYVVGVFTSAGGVSNTTYLAKWDGSNWSAIGTGLYSYGTGVTITPSGTLYVAGYPTDGTVRVAYWTGSTWTSIGTFNGSIFDLISDKSGNIYVCGSFTTINGSGTYGKIAKWNGSTWETLNGGLIDCNQVESMCFDSYDNLFAVGGWTGNNSIYMYNGSSWTVLSNLSGAYGVSCCVDSYDDVWFGGNYTTYFYSKYSS